MADTDKHWREWGEKDPYFGVLSDPKFRRGALEQHRDEFFEIGEAQVGGLIDRFERSFGPLPRGRALDFGCGVGRLTLPLARRFQEAVGLDIAPAMLSEARQNAQRANLSNTQFALSDDRLSAATGVFSFVNTLIVMQHIPVTRGYGIIDHLLSRVEPGGGAHIHFSLRRFQGGFRRGVLWLRNNVPVARTAINMAMGRPASDPPMQMNA